MMYGGGVPPSPSESGNGIYPGLFPSPGYPCLQSARLALHSEVNQKIFHPELSASFMKKIVHLLNEFGVPDRLLPTKRICDANDQVVCLRKFLTFLSLDQKRCRNFALLTEYDREERKGVTKFEIPT
jgi:hypothetical protein